MTGRPTPHPDFVTAPYWERVAQHQFAIPRCEACGQYHFYPRTVCPHCGSDRIIWSDASGKGTIYSFTIIKRAPSPAFESLVPYCVAIVALAEGPHLMSNIVECDVDSVRIGDSVALRCIDLEEGVSLPVFVPEAKI